MSYNKLPKTIERLFFVFLLLLLFVNHAQAQTDKKFILLLSADSASTLTCFLPEKSKATGRAVVCCPGGGYEFLAMDHEGYAWAPFFNRQGIAFFVLKYRMPHGDRALPFSDARKALETVRSHAAEWHIQPHNVGIMGFSAGGHLASTVSTHGEADELPDFSLLFYPVVTMGPGTHLGSRNALLGNEKESTPRQWEYSNERQVRAGITPPALVILATDDTLVPPCENGIAYYEALLRAGIHTELHAYPTGGHGFGFNEDYKYHSEMLKAITSFLDNLPVK